PTGRISPELCFGSDVDSVAINHARASSGIRARRLFALSAARAHARRRVSGDDNAYGAWLNAGGNPPRLRANRARERTERASRSFQTCAEKWVDSSHHGSGTSGWNAAG